MTLRAREPESIKKRLKLFMYGSAGVGKTTAACQMPKPYIIDCEKGTDNYEELIKKSGGRIFQTIDIGEVIAEMQSLLTEKHDFLTLVIDPITTVYQDLLDKSERKVGTEFGRHYGAANREMKRLANLLLSLDMNIIITAHAKTEYGRNLEKIGLTFDGWRRLDYLFDLMVELERSPKNKNRQARVIKTRIKAFPDGDVFDWSYQVISDRCGKTILERPATPIKLATPEQLVLLNELLEVVRVADDWQTSVFDKAGVEAWADMPSDKIEACIKMLAKKSQQIPLANQEKKP